MSLAGLEHGGQGDRHGCGYLLVAERQERSWLVKWRHTRAGCRKRIADGKSKGGAAGVHRGGAECDHLKRFRKRFNGVMTIESNPKYLDVVLELLGLEGAKDVPTPSVPAHKEKLTTGQLLNPAETTENRQCVGGLLYYTQDRADAQCEVSILVSMQTDSRVDDCSKT